MEPMPPAAVSSFRSARVNCVTLGAWPSFFVMKSTTSPTANSRSALAAACGAQTKGTAPLSRWMSISSEPWRVLSASARSTSLRSSRSRSSISHAAFSTSEKMGGSASASARRSPISARISSDSSSAPAAAAASASRARMHIQCSACAASAMESRLAVATITMGTCRTCLRTRPPPAAPAPACCAAEPTLRVSTLSHSTAYWPALGSVLVLSETKSPAFTRPSAALFSTSALKRLMSSCALSRSFAFVSCSMRIPSGVVISRSPAPLRWLTSSTEQTSTLAITFSTSASRTAPSD
mmetsp:Transcript_14632/g.34810  ORF Transcript_14632/g.34810 Transcript_14632/m.34810 type:complete len:295 (+) Transcript_14632:92-976(+)